MRGGETTGLAAPAAVGETTLRVIDPDLLDERARALLDFADPNDLVLQIGR